MKNKKPEVVIIGAAITDLPLRPIPKNICEEVSYPVDRIALTIGGDAINEATIITRLGHPVRLVSCIGRDAAGMMILKHCEQNGIDASFIKVDEGKTTSINVGLIYEDGERTFVTNRNGSLWTTTQEDINPDAIADAKILSFASIFNNPLLDCRAMTGFFKRAKEQGMTICADMVKSRLGEGLSDIREALSYVDYFFPNREEAVGLTGRTEPESIADVLLSCGVKCVVMKLGRRGCLVRNSRESFYVNGYDGSSCIDTTGAGDNFASGFISALLEGKSLAGCAAFANAVASVSVEALGATDGVKNRETAEERYRLYQKQQNGGQEE